jgi:hypothetical protein
LDLGVDRAAAQPTALKLFIFFWTAQCLLWKVWILLLFEVIPKWVEDRQLNPTSELL